MSKYDGELISIIVPIYNTERYLKKCINSLLNQTYKNIEIILIDNASTDNSLKIIKNSLKKDNRIKVFSEKRKGVSFARNLGLAVSKGEYILFVDSDDWVENNMVELMYQELRNNKELDLCICGYNEYLEEKQENRKINYSNNILNNNFIDIILNNNNLVKGYLSNKMFQKKLLKKYFRTDIAIKEDLIFLLSNFNNATRFKIINIPLYNYRINQNSALHSKKITDQKITALKADKWIIDNINSPYIKEYKISFIIEYYYYCSQLEKSKAKMIKKKYHKTLRKYYNEILKDKAIRKDIKFNLIIRRRLYFIYKIFKNIKK